MKIGIVTLVGNNYGNRLQNYALQEFLKSLDETIEVETLKRNYSRNTFLAFIKRNLYKIRHPESEHQKKVAIRFQGFNQKYICLSADVLYKCKNNRRLNSRYDYFVAGSDQVWNPGYRITSSADFCDFADKEKRLSYAASTGMGSLPEKSRKWFVNSVRGMSHLSVREQAGADMIKKETGMDALVHVDPTMLLTAEDWEKLEQKPVWYTGEKYVITYFLGTLDEKREQEIKDTAHACQAEIVCMYSEKQGLQYIHDPAEFVWLIHHAEYVLTDSFHGTVFSLIFGKKFTVYRRRGTENNTGARLDTLLGYFDLSMNGKDEEDFTDYNRSEVVKVLKRERERSKEYLQSILKIKQDGQD